jgi:hypothetical protein
MENRDKLVSEYFELIVLLNKANPGKNQKTEIDFRIEKKDFNTLRLVAFLQGSDQAAYFELCSKAGNRRWRPSDFTGLLNLEKHCANFVRKNSSDNMTSAEMRSLSSGLKNELRSLGISR